jgi:hypothetical protein
MSNDAWSMDECLFIQLYHELLLTAATMPAAPYVYRHAMTHYLEYHRYFTNNPEQLGQASDNEGNRNPKGLDAFKSKRDKLVGAVLWSIRTYSKKAATKRGQTPVVKVTITPQMLEDYRVVRERIGIDTYVHDLMLWPELSDFLQAAVQEEFPNLTSVVESTAGSNLTSQAINPEGDGDTAPQVSTGQLANRATTPSRGTASPEPTNIHDTNNDTPAFPDADNSHPSKTKQTEKKATKGNKRSREDVSEEDEGSSEGSPKKRAKKQAKEGAKKVSVKQKFDDAELAILVQTVNTQIMEHGLTSWYSNFSSHLMEVMTEVNEYRATDKTSYPGDRNADSIRRKITHTEKFIELRYQAESLGAGGDSAEDELKPPNAFTVEDFIPEARAKKGGKGKKSGTKKSR